MAKIYLTKKLRQDLEKAIVIVKNSAKNEKGQVRKDALDVAISLSDILVRQDNRMEKDY